MVKFMKPKLYIVGGGMGDISLYPQGSLEVLKQSKNVLATERIALKLETEIENIAVCTIPEIFEKLEKTKEDTAVLVTGDCGFYSLANTLVKKYKNKFDIVSIAGLNSMQYLLSKLNKPYHNVVNFSLHGRAGNAVPVVTYNEKVFLLTDTENNVKTILERFKTSGLQNLQITVGQNLSAKDEKVTTGDIDTLLQQEFGNLCVMYVENNGATNSNRRLRDNDFTRGKVPMTKEHIRVLSVDRLEIQPEDIVYDIGAGTGSVSVAMAYKANRGLVYAIEQNNAGIDLIETNLKKLGAFNVVPVAGEAPGCFEKLPAPNKAFIGGSGGNLEQIVLALINKNPEILICINVVTLESLFEAKGVFKKFGFEDLEISCLNCANAQPLGNYNMMKAENPIYIISGRANG